MYCNICHLWVISSCHMLANALANARKLQTFRGKQRFYAFGIKEFIAKGNVMELAVAVIIAGGFAVIVASMTSDLIMPIVGMIFGDVDFSAKYTVLSGQELVTEGMSLEAAREAGANVLAGVRSRHR